LSMPGTCALAGVNRSRVAKSGAMR
jgi:hypothetical protein